MIVTCTEIQGKALYAILTNHTNHDHIQVQPVVQRENYQIAGYSVAVQHSSYRKSTGKKCGNVVV